MVRLVVFLFLVLSASPAYAAGGPSLYVHGFYLLNFLVMAYLLYRFVKQPLTNYLTTRSDTIRQEVETARKLREEAIAKYEEAKTKLDQLEGELESMRAHFAAEGEAAKKRLIEAGNKAAEKMNKNVQLLLEYEVKKASAALREELVDKAMIKAESQVREKLTQTVEKKMVTQFIDSLKEREELKQMGDVG